jgi:hypothetical protein
MPKTISPIEACRDAQIRRGKLADLDVADPVLNAVTSPVCPTLLPRASG